MSGREVIVALVIAAALAMAVVGVVALAAEVDFSRLLRSLRSATSREQRRPALGVSRSGGAPAPGEQALVALVAAGLASHGGVALTYAGLVLTSTSMALAASSTPVVVAAVVAAVGNAVVAVVALVRWRRGRGYLDAHRGLVPGGPR